MNYRLFRDRSEAGKHLLSLAVSLVAHALVLGYLVVHFAAVKLLTIHRPQVTNVILAPPLPAGLFLPKVGSMPSDLPPIEPDYLDSIPVRHRPPSPAPTAEMSEPGLSPPLQLTQGFRLDQKPPVKPEVPSSDRLRLPIPDRKPRPGASALSARKAAALADFQTYLYSDAYGGLGAGLSGYSGVKPRRTGLRGGAYASSAVKGYDLTPWANHVASLVQDKWAVPGLRFNELNKAVEITLVVLKNGHIFSAFVAEPSDDKTFDRTALAAVEDSSPLPALPVDFPEASLEVSLVFSRQ